ncbi:hypothetical protein LGX11_09825 [Streptococcus mutans]|nr:hypothetical protein [Streptococcus mutans]
MNTVTLDSMAFDNFEVIDETLLSNIEAGSFSWYGLGEATAKSAVGGAASGFATGAFIGATGGSVVCPGLGTATGWLGCGLALGAGGLVTGAVSGAAEYLVSCW